MVPSHNRGLSYSDPFGLKECDKATGEGCSDEFKRLLNEYKPLETPAIDPVRIATGTAAGAIVGSIGKTTVYSAVEGGVTKYVGITDNLLARAAAHLREKAISIEAIPGLSNLSRINARGVEQALIEHFGLGKNGGTLMNKINSIAPSSGVYDQAVKSGKELLKNVGFPGFD